MWEVRTHEIVPGSQDHRVTLDERDTGLRRIWRILIGADLERVRTFVGTTTRWYEVGVGGFKRREGPIAQWLEERYAEREYHAAQERGMRTSRPVFAGRNG